MSTHELLMSGTQSWTRPLCVLRQWHGAILNNLISADIATIDIHLTPSWHFAFIIGLVWWNFAAMDKNDMYFRVHNSEIRKTPGHFPLYHK